MYNFGENLKRICEEKEMSQPKIAEKMGVTYAAVNQWINGKRVPKGKTAVKIAKKINVPITRLTGHFPCGEAMEKIFERAINEIGKHKEKLDEAEHLPEELGGISREYEVEVLEQWEDFLKETFFNIITFAVSTPYPFGYVPYDEEDEEDEEDDRTSYSAEREDASNNELWRIRKEMLSSMKESGISDMRQYNLVESLSSHILPAVYKTMAYAVRTENEGMDTIALLYKQLNAKGKEVAIERLQELAQLPSYTD